MSAVTSGAASVRAAESVSSERAVDVTSAGPNPVKPGPCGCGRLVPEGDSVATVAAGVVSADGSWIEHMFVVCRGGVTVGGQGLMTVGRQLIGVGVGGRSGSWQGGVVRVIEVFADVSCPFTHVGLRRLAEMREQKGRDDVVMRVRCWPLQIVNDAPLDAHFIAEEIDDIRAQVAPDLFTGFREEAFPSTTLPALALAAAADVQDVRVGERVSLAMRWMLFEEGIDVSDPAVLRAVADEHGVDWADVDEARVLADHEEGRRRGVVGSPHFFTPTVDLFCPVLDISRNESGHLDISAGGEEYERFMAACFD